MCYPVDPVDSKVTELHADFLPERVFDAHMHIYCRDTIPNFYGSRAVFCREAVTPEHYRRDAAPFLPGVGQ